MGEDMSSSNPSWVTLLTVVTKCLTKQLKEDLFVLHSVMVGSHSGRRETPLTLSPGRKQRERGRCWCSAGFSFLESLGPQPTAWYHPY